MDDEVRTMNEETAAPAAVHRSSFIAHHFSLPRLLALSTLVAVAAGAAWFLYGTETGRWVRETTVIRDWIAARPTVAPLAFIAGYAIVGALALPVWWMQVIAGYCFGTLMGVVWCQAGAVVGAVISMRVGHWLFGEWFRERVESHRARLRALDERLGHNGLLVVTAVRLSHVMPFGVSNYLFSVTRISLIDVVIGTILGGTFSKMIHVPLGDEPSMLVSAEYWAIISAVNAVLLSPLLLRYLFPQWFRRIGVE
jgi:uncharacterized membrane protein YdjX (TVP38/TMEM64 family)